MEAEIKSIFETELGEDIEGFEQIVGGLNSKTYRVRTRNNSYVLQLTSNSEPHELENCVRSFEFLEDTRVPVPGTVTDGVQESDSSHYTIVDELPGEAISEVSDSSVTRKAGEYLAAIHNSKSFENVGWIEWRRGEPEVLGFEEGSLKGRIKQLMKDRLEFCRENDIDWLAEITERFLDNHVHKVPESFEPVFVHHDFNPGNTLTKDGKITGVLDFDYAHSSHAQRDLAKAANKFWLRGGEREELYKGYEKIRELDDFGENKNIYLLESLIDEIVSMIEYEHVTPEDCEKYEEELMKLINREC